MDTDPIEVIRQVDRVGRRVRHFWRGLCLNFLLLVFGPGLILLGVNSLPPQWRPGLNWPIHGAQAPATVRSVRLALRHVDDTPRIDNLEASLAVSLAYHDAAGAEHHAELAGPWMLQTATQWTGDAAWFYLADAAHLFGVSALEVDMPADVAAQLARPHAEFGAGERSAENLDRPLRWIALAWVAPQHALTVRYDPAHAEIAIPDAVIARESTRLQGIGVLRVLGFVLGCLLVGAFAWRVFSFPQRALRWAATLAAIASILLWAPYVGTLIRIVLPGIDSWSGLNVDKVVADPLAPFYDEFRFGPYYAAAKAPPVRRGTAWTVDALSAHALTEWLREIPVAPVAGGFDAAEAALSTAAIASLPQLDTARLQAISVESIALATRRNWSGIAHYREIREAVRAELARRGVEEPTMPPAAS